LVWGPRLRFATKRTQVDRLKRVAAVEVLKREETVEEKMLRCDATIAQQQGPRPPPARAAVCRAPDPHRAPAAEYVELRRQMAIDSQVKAAKMYKSIRERPHSAPNVPLEPMKDMEQMNALVGLQKAALRGRSRELGGKENKGNELRGRLVVAAPSVANRWSGAVEESTVLESHGAGAGGLRVAAQSSQDWGYTARLEMERTRADMADAFEDESEALAPRDDSGRPATISLSTSISLLKQRAGSGEGWHVSSEDTMISKRPMSAGELATSGMITPRTGQALYTFTEEEKLARSGWQRAAGQYVAELDPVRDYAKHAAKRELRTEQVRRHHFRTRPATSTPVST
jgi:hypothetical protein